MNILVVCDYKINPNRIGGMDRFFKFFDKQVKTEGHQVSWIFSDVITHDFYEKLTITSAENKEIMQCVENFLDNNSNKIDVLITHFVTQYSPHFKKFKNVYNIGKIFCVDHNPRPLEGFPLKKRIKKRIKGFLYHAYIDKIIGVSEYTSKHSIKDFGAITAKNTQTIYNGIDASVFKNKKLFQNTNETIKFIVVSHLRHSKGIQDLLEALHQLTKEEISKVTVDIYGMGPYEETLKVLSKQYDLENRVTFKGSSPEIHLGLYTYDYMLQPTYMECFSLSILESLLSNVPVVTTRVGGNAEVIVSGENGWLYDAGDITALTYIIKNIVSNKYSIQHDVYEEIEEKYSIELMVSNHIKILNN